MLLEEIMDALLTNEEINKLLEKAVVIWPRRKMMTEMHSVNIKKMFPGCNEEFASLGAQFLNEIAIW